MKINQQDPELAKFYQAELQRQRHTLEMIPSENFVSEAVLEALGGVGTNKYSEGYPGARYYGGNQYIDQIENLARDRAKQLFGVDHVNVQPYSGSPANQAAIFSVAKPGEKIIGMSLLFGGHLTHGWKINFSGVYYNAVQYQTGPDGILNYDELEKIVKAEKPKVLFCGATAYPRLFDYKRIAKIVHSVGGYFIADIAHECGLMAARVIPTPVGHADIITTTTHKSLRGPRGAMIMCNGKPAHPLKPLAEDENPRENLPTLIDRAVFPGLQGGPHNHTTTAIAVALGEALKPEFKIYAQQILNNAHALAGSLMSEGLVLATGGTDNHLMIIDLTNLGIGGKVAENALEEVGITANKNTIPFDKRKPYDPSGVRLGTPALTTRGFKEDEMKTIGQLIAKTLKNTKNETVKEEIKKSVLAMTDKYPLYPNLRYV
ncbi:MAG: serine hydroxymethyltransferase [Candidatus Komeilibacteria bacterium]|nr:serine hydroxymethyltransferase [Candidatus Komeilibacteria bacterium]